MLSLPSNYLLPIKLYNIYPFIRPLPLKTHSVKGRSNSWIMVEDMESPAQDVGWVEGYHAWKRKKSHIWRVRWYGNKKGQKSFIN